MFMRSACAAMVLWGWVAGARADWQPEPPPVPPETENAQRARSAPSATASGPQTPTQPAQPSAADTTQRPEATTGSSPAASAAQAAPPSPSTTRSNASALQAFPPAPPPVVPGAAPAETNAALTSFAPAPAPDGPAPAMAEQAAPAPSAAERADQADAVGAPSPAPPSAQAEAEPAAAAGGTATSTRGSVAALVGVGASFDDTVAGVNPLGFGFGVRGDYRILPSWSLGARLVYFVGGSVELPTHDVAMQSWLIAAEGAYVLDLDPLIVQPGLALGLYVRETNHRGYAPFITSDPTSTAPPDRTRLFVYLAPGLNVTLPLATATPALAPLTLGADVRLDLGLGKQVTGSIQLLGQLGLRF